MEPGLPILMIVQTLPGSNYYELQACIECAKIAMQTHLYITKINYLTQVLWYFLWMKFGFTCTSLLRHQAASLRLWYSSDHDTYHSSTPPPLYRLQCSPGHTRCQGIEWCTLLCP